MLMRVIEVEFDGQTIAGDIEVAPGETLWQFRPHSPWHSGAYRLIAETTLEDSAGNSLARPFEIAMWQTSTEPDQQPNFHRTFSITAP